MVKEWREDSKYDWEGEFIDEMEEEGLRGGHKERYCEGDVVRGVLREIEREMPEREIVKD